MSNQSKGEHRPLAVDPELDNTSFEENPDNHYDVDALLSAEPGDDPDFQDPIPTDDEDYDEEYEYDEEDDEEDSLDVDPESEYDYDEGDEPQDDVDDDEEDPQISPREAEMAARLEALERQFNQVSSERDRLLAHTLGESAPEKATPKARDVLEGLDTSFNMTDEQFELAAESKEGMKTVMEQLMQKTLRVALEASDKFTEDRVKRTFRDQSNFVTTLRSLKSEHADTLRKAGAEKMFNHYLDQAYNNGQLNNDNLEQAFETLVDYSVARAKEVLAAQGRTKKPKRRGTKRPPNVSPSPKGRGGAQRKRARKGKQQSGPSLSDLIHTEPGHTAF